MKKTNALRLLDQHNIPYTTQTYEVQGDHDSKDVLNQLQLDPGVVFKTIVLKGDKTGYLVALVPVLEEIDVKQLAKNSHNKKVEPVPTKDLLSLTGYVRGGCSPIGMKKKFDTYIDTSITSLSTVVVSAGIRGLQVVLSPLDLINVCDAKVLPLIKY